MSIMVAVGKGATAGVLVKSAESLQKLVEIDTVAFDKTGTLTMGRPKVTRMDCDPSIMDQKRFLELVASIEQVSEHPLAHAIVEAAKADNLTLQRARDFTAYSGRGVRGHADGHELIVGNSRFIEEQGIRFTTPAISDEMATHVYVAIDGQYAGYLAIADPIKENAKNAIDALHARGLRLVMLTGDQEATAQAVARRLGIDEVYAQILPEDKAKIVEKLKKEGRKVAMAGDGINDAPALALADVGIAMGSGTDIAIESADLVLTKGDLGGIVRAFDLAVAMVRNIRQNLFFAFVYNALGVPVAAGILYPFWGILLSPMLAALAMSLSSVSVIANALRLRYLKL
jgi:Cu+-exporting ATPase